MRKAIKYDALQLADDLVKWPYERYEAAAELRRLHALNAELVEALRDIADPIAAWQRDLEDGYTLNGAMCVQMASDPETYKRMARAALAKCEVSNEP